MGVLPNFGIHYIRQDDQGMPVLGANLNVVGIIGPCSTADAATFPYDTPVYLASNDTAKLAKLGTDGFIADAINAINAQLADYQVAAQIVVVRTRYGTDNNATVKLQQTIANIMGSSVAGTGVWAFLKAPSMLYTTPRMIIAPGYTGQMANSLDTLVTAVSGEGYIPGQSYQISFVNGNSETNGANLVLPIAHAVANSDGTITDASIVIDSYGAWMTDAPTATLSAPDGPQIDAAAATGSIIFSRQPGVGSTITLNGTVISFVSGTPSTDQVQLGADLAATMANLLAVLNDSIDTQVSKCSYTLSGGTIGITYKTTGTAGNAFTLSATATGVSLSASTLTGGHAAGSSTQATLTATIALGANPVCAALSGGVLDGLQAHAWVESAGSSYIGDLNWRNTLNSQRLIGLSGGVKVLDSEGDIVIRPFAPRVVGAQIARDYATGYPFHSAANTPISGIVGPARTIAFSLTDGSTEGQQLLGANLGILVRGLVGVETAISSGGFVFVGTDNLGDNENWRFSNVTRGRDYIELSLLPAWRTYLGRSNIDAQTITNLILTARDFLNLLQAKQQILGSNVTFQGSLNSAPEIRAGRVTVSFQVEEPPVLRRITAMSARYRPAIDQLIINLQQQLNITG